MKPVDLTKFRKHVNSKLGIADGYHDPKVWLDTGSYALNKMISGDFFKGVPLGKVTVFAGESGAGKSYIVAGNLVRSAQKAGILPVILDSEYALDEQWLKNLGVDTDPSKLIRIPVALVDDVASIVNDFMAQYLADYAKVSDDERQGVLFIVDSLGMLSTPTEVDQFNKGDMKGDMGRKARQLKALVTQCLKIMGPHKVGLVATNHTYKSQDMYNPDDVISGGVGFIYASSIVVAMRKGKLKDAKTKEINGIVSKMKCVKSRYAKPFEEVEVEIPYTTGMNPYSGLFDMFVDAEMISAAGSWYTYEAKDGTVYKQQGQNFPIEAYHKMMADFTDDDRKVGVGDDLEKLAEEADREQ